MLVTLSGMVTLVRLQSANADAPMLMTPLPIVTLVRLVQKLNVPAPMLVTLPGMVMLVNLGQSEKALALCW